MSSADQNLNNPSSQATPNFLDTTNSTPNDESKAAKKARKAEEKAQRKANYAKWKEKQKKNKQEQKRVIRLYANKQKELKQKYTQAIQSPKADVKALKKQYQIDTFNLRNQRDLALLPYLGNERTKDREKMKVDKRIAFKRYDEAKERLMADKKHRFSELETNYQKAKKANDEAIHIAKLKMVDPIHACQVCYQSALRRLNKEHELLIAKARNEYNKSLKKENANKQELKTNYDAQLIDLQKKHQQLVNDLKDKQPELQKQAKIDLEYLNKQKPIAISTRNKQIAECKQKYHASLTDAKNQYKHSLQNIKTQSKTTNREAIAEAKEQYIAIAGEIERKYHSEIANIKSTSLMPFGNELEFLLNKRTDIKDNYESQLINTKIWFRNTLIQIKTQRDIAYQYELDSSYLIKRWFYGVGKEFQRMSWPSPKKTVKDFFITIGVAGLIALFFLLLDYIINLI